jgi:putative ABC transport system substrate-binding protein
MHSDQLRRRNFIMFLGGAAVVWPLVVRAQQAAKVPRVGVLSPGNPPPADAFLQRERFEARLNELGWRPGSTILIEYRYAEGRLERLPALAADLVRIPVDAIVARGLTIAVARQATATIPIVMAADPDPVRNGFVTSLSRPGGNITGLSTQALESEPKQLELLRSVLPSLKVVAVLTNANSPDDEQAQRTAMAAQALRLELKEFPISRSEELERTFEMMTQAGARAALFRGTLWFLDAKEVAAVVLKHRLPTIHNLREFALAGAFMSYGVNFEALHRRAADFIEKILKGANPAALPVEQPTKFEFIINFKTAKLLDIGVPPGVSALADEVIE